MCTSITNGRILFRYISVEEDFQESDFIMHHHTLKNQRFVLASVSKTIRMLELHKVASKLPTVVASVEITPDAADSASGVPMAATSQGNKRPKKKQKQTGDKSRKTDTTRVVTLASPARRDASTQTDSPIVRPPEQEEEEDGEIPLTDHAKEVQLRLQMCVDTITVENFMHPLEDDD